jgi:hypothetical protein
MITIITGLVLAFILGVFVGAIWMNRATAKALRGAGPAERE